MRSVVEGGFAQVFLLEVHGNRIECACAAPDQKKCREDQIAAFLHQLEVLLLISET
jgi:hypothetical protein